MLSNQGQIYGYYDKRIIKMLLFIKFSSPLALSKAVYYEKSKVTLKCKIHPLAHKARYVCYAEGN